MSRKWFLFLRCCVSFGLLCALVVSVDYRSLAGLLPNVAIRLSFLGLILVLLDRTLMALRWHILLKAVHVTTPLIQVVKVYWMAGFFGMFLPSSVAPDVMRAYLAAKYHCPGGLALASVFWDRFIAFASLSLLASCSWLVLYLRGELQVVSPPMMAAILGSLGIVTLVFVGLRYFNHLVVRAMVFTGRFESVLRMYENFAEYLIFYTRVNSDFVRVLCISLLNHAIFVVTIYVLILALDFHILMINLFVVVPLVTFITILPISINGLGVQESVYVYVLSKAGLSVPEGFAVAVLVRIVTTLGSLPGGLVYLWSGTESRSFSAG